MSINLFIHDNIFFVTTATQIQMPTVSMARLRSQWISNTSSTTQKTVRMINSYTKHTPTLHCVLLNCVISPFTADYGEDDDDDDEEDYLKPDSDLSPTSTGDTAWTLF